MKEIGIYVHIPFCKSKCLYCDFTSYTDKNTEIRRYVDCLKREINYRSKDEYLVKTIFFGGGTPSIIDGKYIVEILSEINNAYIVDKNAEITIEINPGTIDKHKLEKYKEAGINRISIGLQSSKKELLKEIGRIHTYEDFENTVKLAKDVGFTNINVDLMIGIPNQTIYDVEDTLDKVLALDLTHISVYSLIYEDGTLMTKMVDEGKLLEIDEEIERYMYWYAKRRLEDNGFIHYEISNFAKPSYRCKHNLDCWNQKEYLGFGVAAASYIDNFRIKNTDSLEKYINNINSDKYYKNLTIEEKQDIDEQMKEFVILRLRMTEGFKASDFTAKFNKDVYKVFESQMDRLLSDGLIIAEEFGYLKLTKKGLDLANIVWGEFI
jgi:putative coproporphyrinogen dehydrogenase